MADSRLSRGLLDYEPPFANEGQTQIPRFFAAVIACSATAMGASFGMKGDLDSDVFFLTAAKLAPIAGLWTLDSDLDF